MYKTEKITLRANKKECEIIKKKAFLCQMSVSEFLRKAGTEYPVEGFIYNNKNEQIEGQLSFEEMLSPISTYRVTTTTL